MRLACGIDVGGTKIGGGIVDEQGNVLVQARAESPALDTAAIEGEIARLVSTLCADHTIDAVGVGAAGFIDSDRSTVRFAPNLAWRDENLGVELSEQLGLPVVVENDANAAAWGEFAYGAGADVDDLLLVTVGTGVGGGIVLDGELYRGASGVAAEIGHLRVVPQGRPCGCGNLGCWEQYASGSALVSDTKAAAAASPELAHGLVERAGGSIEAITGPLITVAAQAGDEFAVARLAELGRWLGEGIASLSAVLDPARVVIGGGVGAAGDLLLDPIREALAANLTARGHRPPIDVRSATLGNLAGIVGAADLARRTA